MAQNVESWAEEINSGEPPSVLEWASEINAGRRPEAAAQIDAPSGGSVVEWAERINKLSEYAAPREPEWLRRAFDPSSPRIQNPDGSESSIRTITVEADGLHHLLPTIRMQNGEPTQLSNDEAIEEAFRKRDTLAFKTQEEADTYSRMLSESLGKSGTAGGPVFRAAALDLEKLQPALETQYQTYREGRRRRPERRPYAHLQPDVFEEIARQASASAAVPKEDRMTTESFRKEFNTRHPNATFPKIEYEELVKVSETARELVRPQGGIHAAYDAGDRVRRIVTRDEIDLWTPSAKKALLYEVADQARKRGRLKEAGLGERLGVRVARGVESSLDDTVIALADAIFERPEYHEYIGELTLAMEGGDPISANLPWYARWPIEAAGMGSEMAMGFLAGGMLGEVGSGLKVGAKVTGLANKARRAGEILGQTAYWAARIYPDELRTLKAAGVDDATAQWLALASAIAQGAIENLEYNPFRTIGKATGARAIGRSLEQRWSELVVAGAKEWTEEPIQAAISGFSQMAGEAIAKTGEPKTTVADVTKQVYDALEQSFGPLVVLMGVPAAVRAPGLPGRIRQEREYAAQVAPIMAEVAKMAKPPAPAANAQALIERAKAEIKEKRKGLGNLSVSTANAAAVAKAEPEAAAEFATSPDVDDPMQRVVARQWGIKTTAEREQFQALLQSELEKGKPQAKQILTPDGAAEWAKANPEQASNIVTAPDEAATSRKGPMAGLGLKNKTERERFRTLLDSVVRDMDVASVSVTAPVTLTQAVTQPPADVKKADIADVDLDTLTDELAAGFEAEEAQLAKEVPSASKDQKTGPVHADVRAPEGAEKGEEEVPADGGRAGVYEHGETPETEAPQAVVGPSATRARLRPKIDQAKADVQDALKEIADKLTGGELRAGIDPALVKPILKLTAGLAKQGIYKFADAVVALAELAPKLVNHPDFQRAIESGWRQMHERFGQIEAPGKVADVLKGITDAADRESIVERGAGPTGGGKPGAPGGAVAERPTPGAPGQPRAEGVGAGAAVEGQKPRPSISAGERGQPTGAERGERPATEARPEAVEREGATPSEPVPGAGKRGERIDHRIAAGVEIAPKGEVGKVRANLRAVQVLKHIESQGRHATPEEQAILVKYVGWGGVSEVLNTTKGEAYIRQQEDPDLKTWNNRGYDENWSKKYGKHYAELKSMLSDEEWQAATSSTLNAHYTSPEVVSAMWRIAERFGFKGGTVLEPAAGIGHFLGLMPETTEKTSTVAVEMDSLSARILGALYPNATTVHSPFEQVPLANNSTDLVITNVPFASEGPADGKNRYGQEISLHNYFLARGLDALRPGGVMIAITSSRTMDAAGGPRTANRKLLAGKGELVGAIRLPNDAFLGNARTKVTTDILMFRKPTSDVREFNEPWESIKNVVPEILDEKGKVVRPGIPVNEYFANNPGMMLGTPTLEGTMYAGGRGEEFTLEPFADRDLADLLDAAIKGLPEGVMTDADYQHDIADQIRQSVEVLGMAEHTLSLRDGEFMVVADGKLVQAGDEYPDMKKKAVQARARDYLPLRDQVHSHINMQLDPDMDEGGFQKSLARLNKLYDRYRKKHGPLNSFKGTRFAFDPGYYLTASVEDDNSTFDPATGKGKAQFDKGTIFTERVVPSGKPPESADSIADALGISLAYRGSIDSGWIAKLTGLEKAEAERALIDENLVFRDPDSGLWQTKDRYLTGNVRKKLREAEIAAKADKQYERNVEALAKAQPAPKGIKEIYFRLGGTWIPPSVATGFANELLDGNGQITYNREADAWSVTGMPRNVRNTEEWGTARMRADQLIAAALNLRGIRIYDRYKGPNGKTVSEYNHRETVAAQAKQEKIQAEFKRWVKRDESRETTLQDAFNEEFNFFVMPKYDGSHLTFPYMSNAVTLYPFQKDVVWRNLQERRAYLAHAVGAGKTFEMIATAMEMKRMGIAEKPMIVVQNATLGQFAETFSRMYPAANIMVAQNKDLTKKNRKKFLTRIATGKYDAIIIAQSQYGLIPVSPQREVDFSTASINELLGAQRQVILEDGKTSPTVKQLARQINRLGKRLAKMSEAHAKRAEDAVNFEQLGIDALFLDEAHAYKKPLFVTKMPPLVGLERQDSQRGTQTLMKARVIQERQNGRGVFLASGTPITNTLGEAWHMQRILAPDVLEEFGVETFDRFISTFANVRPTIEQNAGGTWVLKQAVESFANGTILHQMLRSTWDILLTDELHGLLGEEKIKIPKIKGGKPETIPVPLSPDMKKFRDWLADIYRKFENLDGRGKREFNYIPVLTYGASRAAAIDVRLVYPTAGDEPGSKVNTMVDRAFRIWEDQADRKGAQLIFCDSSNHVNMEKLVDFAAGGVADLQIDERGEEPEQTDLWLYRDIKNKLVRKGVPAEQIAIINEHNTDAKTTALFGRVNAGEVRFLIGHTIKMGVGVNVQERLYAIHNLDAPWTPADVEQRTGRILRQGNSYAEIEVLHYGMIGTLDAAIQAKLLRKAKQNQQGLTGKLNEFEDPAGKEVMSAAEQLAFYADDPRMFERLELEAELRNLKLEQESFEDGVARRRSDKRTTEERIALYEKVKIPHFRKIGDALEAAQQPVFAIDVDGQSFTDRKEAIKAIDAGLTDEIMAKAANEAKAGNRPELDQMTGEGMSDETRILSVAMNGVTVEWHASARVKLDTGVGGKGVRRVWVPSRKRVFLFPGREHLRADESEAWQARRVVEMLEHGLVDAQRSSQKWFEDKLAREKTNLSELDRLATMEFEGAARIPEIEERLEEIKQSLLGEAGGEAGRPAPAQPIKIGKKDIIATFKGATITDVGDTGWLISYGRKDGTTGRYPYNIRVQVVDQIPIDWDALEEATGKTYTPQERNEIEASGSVVLRPSDDGRAKKTTVNRIIYLSASLADNSTIREEAFHLAWQSDLFTKKERSFLIRRYVPRGITNPRIQEEFLAGIFANNPRNTAGLAAHVRQWLDKIVASFGFNTIDFAAVEKLIQNPEFWQRQRDGGSEGGASNPPAYQIRRMARPARLANPAFDKDVRELVDKATREKYHPDVISDTFVEAEAEKRVETTEQMEEELRNALNVAENGGQLDAIGTMVARKVMDRIGVSAIASGDDAEISKVAQLVEAYRHTGHVQAVAFRSRRDLVETKQERAARSAVEAVVALPQRERQAMDEARERGDQAAMQAILDRHVESIKALREQLRLQGIELDRMREVVQDHRQAAKAVRTIAAFKADVWDVAYEHWIAGILSGPPTNIVNFSGNFLHGAAHLTIKRLLEATINTFAKDPHQAQWTELKPMIRALWKSLGPAWANLAETWATEINAFRLEHGEIELAGKFRETEKSGTRFAIPGKWGRFVRSGYGLGGPRLMEAVDAAFLTAIARTEVAAFAHRKAKQERLRDPGIDAKSRRKTDEAGRHYDSREDELCSDYTSEAWEEAAQSARSVTFRTPLGHRANILFRIRNAFPGVRYRMPFITTVVNLFKAAGKHYFAPISTIRLSQAVYKGIKTGDWRHISDRTADAIISGVILWVLLGQDDDDPWITGTESADWRDKQLAYRTMPPLSIRVPYTDFTFGYGRYEPFATAISLTLDWIKAIKHGGKPSRISTNMAVTTAGQVENKTFLQGVGGLITAARSKEPGSFTKFVIEDMAASWWPKAFVWIPRASNRLISDRRVPSSLEGAEWMKDVGRSFIQKLELPFSDTLLFPDIPLVDIWGQEVRTSNIPQTDSPGNPAPSLIGAKWTKRDTFETALRSILPSGFRERGMFAGDLVLNAWNLHHPDEPFKPGRPWAWRDWTPVDRRGRKIEGEHKRPMKDEEWLEFQRLAGRAAKMLVEEEIVSTPFNPTAEDVKMIRDNLRAAREYARNALVRQWSGHQSKMETAEEVAQQIHQRHIIKKTKILAKRRPKKPLGRGPAFEEWQFRTQELKEQQAEAAEWLHKQGYSVQEAATQYWRDVNRPRIDGATNPDYIKEYETRKANYERLKFNIRRMAQQAKDAA